LSESRVNQYIHARIHASAVQVFYQLLKPKKRDQNHDRSECLQQREHEGK
jgi:hypothetical protein